MISLSEFQEQLTLWEPPEGFEAITSVDIGKNTEITGKLKFQKCNFKFRIVKNKNYLTLK